MAQLVAVSIDLTKIDKSRIINGAKGGKYVNLTVSVNDEADQYGNNVSIWQSQTKEEREAKASRLFLGNGKSLWSGDTQSKENKPQPNQGSLVVDDLPF